VRCGEAEAGAFSRAGRRWRGGKKADGSGLLILIGFEQVKGKRRRGNIVSIRE
jgi:hypothetical protein